MSVAKGGIFLFTGNTLSFVLGYIFWIIVAKLIGAKGPEMIGYVGAAVAFAAMIASITSLGIPTAVQRFIGISYSEKNTVSISNLFKTSLILQSSTSILASGIVWIFKEQIMSFTKFSWEILLLTLILLNMTLLFTLLQAVLISINKAKFIMLSNITQGLSKILFMVIFILLGFGLTGLVGSFIISYIVALPIMLSAMLLFMPLLVKNKFIENAKMIVKAGWANWLPGIISTIGTQLSVIFILGYSGAQQAGGYYIASIIFGIITIIPMALFQALYPVLSGMSDRRNELTWKITRIGLLFSTPLAVILMLYANEILNLIGREFQIASTIQVLFMIAVWPLVLNYGVYYLLYATGKYRNVLMLGLAENLTRIILYIILVPQFGSLGAVSSFVLGSIAALIVIVSTQRKLYTISWKSIVVIIGIPGLLGIVLYAVKLNPVIAISVILATSFLLYIRFTMIQLDEIESSDFLYIAKRFGRKGICKNGTHGKSHRPDKPW